MPAYVVVHITIEDPELWDEYRQSGMPTIAAAGGRLLAGGEGITLEGDEMPNMSAVVEFPDVAQAQAWFDSEVYQEASAKRRKASKVHFFGIVPGVAA